MLRKRVGVAAAVTAAVAAALLATSSHVTVLGALATAALMVAIVEFALKREGR